MKKLLFILIAFKLFSSCTPTELNPEDVFISTETDFDKLAQEYNIQKDGLFLEDVIIGVDTTQIFFNGRFNDKLWIGVYNKTTKSQIFEWSEDAKLDTIFNLHIGYGEYSNFKVEKFFLRYPYYTNGQLNFLLWGWGYNDKTMSMNGRIISSDLYFIKNNSFIKKQRSFTYPISDAFYYNIVPWENSIFSKFQNKYICFSTEGDSIYSTETVSDYYEPINIEECIELRKDYVTNESRMFYFRRLNLKSNETIWKTENTLVGMPINDRLDKVTLEKGTNTWVYKFICTAFVGGEYIIKVELNIESGELETDQ